MATTLKKEKSKVKSNSLEGKRAAINPDDLVSVSEFAEIKGLTRNQMNGNIFNSNITPVRIGGKLYIDKVANKDWVPNLKKGRPGSGLKKQLEDIQGQLARLTERLEGKKD